MIGQDRQDNTIKATWWFITAYNEDIELLEGCQVGTHEWPQDWNKIYGGKETCPETGRLHFQGCINTASIRRSQVKKVLTQSWIRKAEDKIACQKYVMKEATSAGEKRIVKN